MVTSRLHSGMSVEEVKQLTQWRLSGHPITVNLAISPEQALQTVQDPSYQPQTTESTYDPVQPCHRTQERILSSLESLYLPTPPIYTNCSDGFHGATGRRNRESFGKSSTIRHPSTIPHPNNK